MNNYSILKDLEDFLIYEKIEKIKLEFIQGHYENIDVIVCDHDLGVLTVNPDSSEKEFATISFEKEYLRPQLYRKTQELKKNVDNILIELTASQDRQKGFFRYLNNTIEFIRKRQERLFKEFPICNKPFVTIEKYLSDKYADGLKEVYLLNSKQQTLMRNPLFENFPIIKIKELHSLLIKERPFIEVGENEFINAFSGKGVSTGIKWLVKNKKNKNDISKPSLFYLIEQLINKGYIDDNNDSSFLKEITFHLFRDINGNPFKSASLSTSVTNYKRSQAKKPPTLPTRKDDIDRIISQL